MSTNQIRCRVVYPGNRIYYIIASSDIKLSVDILCKLNGSMCKRFEKKEHKYSAIKKINATASPNALATIFGFPRDEKLDFLHVFIKDGNVLDAMHKMVALLDKRHHPYKHVEPITCF